jgi:hypothetical protein
LFAMVGLNEFFKLHALCFSMSKCPVSFQGSLLFFGRQRKVTKETLSLNFISPGVSPQKGGLTGL